VMIFAMIENGVDVEGGGHEGGSLLYTTPFFCRGKNMFS